MRVQAAQSAGACLGGNPEVLRISKVTVPSRTCAPPLKTEFRKSRHSFSVVAWSWADYKDDTVDRTPASARALISSDINADGHV